MREAKLARPVSAPAPRRTAQAAPRPASAIGNRAMHAAVTGASALPRAPMPAGPIHAWTSDVVANDAGPRAPWDRAQRQQAALAALAGGGADGGQRKFLIDEIHRQVPDVAYMEQVAAGARTVVTLIVPGNGPLGLKTLNDDIVGYQINNSMIGPQRNEVVKNAFLGVGGEPGASPFVVTEQTYKMTTVTSSLPPPQLRDAMQQVLGAIDRGVRAVYLDGLRYGRQYWTDQSDSENADGRAEAMRRVANIQEAIARVEAPEFQLDFQFGMAAIERGAGGHSYTEALTAHLRASQATLMSREPTQVSTSDVGDSRGQIYRRDVFRRFSKEGESLRQQVIGKGNTLTYRGRQYRVFVGEGKANRDVLRDVRKGKVKEEELASERERETLRLFQRYFLHINAFDNLRDFRSEEVGQVGEQIEHVEHLINSLRGKGSVDARKVTETLHTNPAMGEVIPRQDTAAEAVFYNAGQSRTRRIIVSCDIRDMGVDVVQHYGEAMHRVSRGEDPDDVAREAADPMVGFRRRAIASVHHGYQEMIREAIKAAEQGGDGVLAHELHAEIEPSLLMGGDEITLSLHEKMRPYLPRLAAVLMAPNGPRARVAISTTGDSSEHAVKDHIAAQQRADPAHSVLKEFEAEQRDLDLMVDDIDDIGRRHRGAALVYRLGLNRLYAESEGASIVLRRSGTGAVVDSHALRGRIGEVRRQLRELNASVAW